MIVLLTTLSLAGCETRDGNKQVGQVLGGIAGAVLGSQIGSGAGRLAATIGLGALGAWLGGELGEELSREDRNIVDRTTNTALENNAPGQASAWSNPKSGASGTVTPGPYYVAKANTAKAASQTCRKINIVVSPSGKPVKRGQRTACRTQSGEWELVGA